MMDLSGTVAFIKRTYPIPEVDPAWVQECAQALEAAGQPASIDELHTQYLYTDLGLSTLESRTLPSDQGELHDIIVCQRPTLFQIVSMSEIGHSAFQLQTVMEQRSEVLSGQSRIRRMDDEEDDEDTGRVPPYPRGMLRLEISDGRRVVKAMEYRRIPDLVLGQTSLGCKLLMQNVRCLRNILLLSPDNCQVLESSVEHIEALQREQFIGDLNRRMGKVAEGEEEVDPPVQQVLPPPVHNDHPTLPRRRQSSPVENISYPQIVRPQPERHISVQQAAKRKAKSKAEPQHEHEHERTKSTPNRRTSRTAAQKASARLDKLYETNPPPDMLLGEKRAKNSYEDDEDDLEYLVDDSFLRHVEEAETRALNSIPQNQASSHRRRTVYDDESDDVIIFTSAAETSKKRVKTATKTSHYFQPHQGGNATHQSQTKYHEPYDDDDEYGFDADESFIRQLDEVEARASFTARDKQFSSSGQSTRSTLVGDGGPTIPRRGARERGGKMNPSSDGGVGAVEVIEISD